MSFRDRVRAVVENRHSRAGRAFEWTIESLIVLSIIAFSLETMPRLPLWASQALFSAEVVFTVVFTAEYLLRLYAANRRLAYAFSFFGLIDLLAIAPFYVTLIASSTDAATFQAVRIFRLLRMFRLLKLARYNRAMRRFRRAFLSIREELVLTGTITACVIYFAAVMIYHFEREAQPEQFSSVFDALWWSVVTLTTVGYGDVYPVTPGGRFFTGLLLIAGLGLVSIPSGLIASAMTATRRQEHKEDHGSEQEPP